MVTQLRHYSTYVIQRGRRLSLDDLIREMTSSTSSPLVVLVRLTLDDSIVHLDDGRHCVSTYVRP